MTEGIRELLEDVRREAERANFPVDVEVYHRSGRDPKCPILFAGSLDVPLCVVGRDLGKDEVRSGQPLIGAAGRLVRIGIIRSSDQNAASEHTPPPVDPGLEQALNYALLTNIVPYKPIGNKAFNDATRERFRPFLERLMVHHWHGTSVITLGTQAFSWFARYCEDCEFPTAGDARFEMAFRCTLPAFTDRHSGYGKILVVYPLPHPSPLNRRWFSRFPLMLAARLTQVHDQLA